MLGAGMIAVVDCLYAPSIIFFSILWLNESLTLWQIIGVILIVSAVLTATGESSEKPEKKKTILLGILFGVLAILTMTMGLVMIKPVLDRSPLIWTTQMRMIGGLLSLVVILAFNPRRKAIIKSVFVRSHWWYTLMGSWLGGYAATMMWLAGMKFTQASVASALNQTSNIFIFIFAAFFLKERITRFKLAGIILGMIGAVLVILA
jgi:drug/metabolite transporter (DMT)-like permease